MPATAPAPRLQFAKALLGFTLFLAGLHRPVAAQQLGATFTLDDQQTAVVHVGTGQFVRVRLKNGARAGGPLIRATPLALTVGPSVAFGDQDTVLRLRNVDSMWVRVYSTRRGTMAGALVGGLAGLGIGMSAASLSPVDGLTKPCAQGAVTSAVTGALFGGLAGSLLGSGRSHWRRLLPQSGEPPAPADLTVATLTVPDDSAAFDPRALALMRVPRGNLGAWNGLANRRRHRTAGRHASGRGDRHPILRV